MTTPWHEQTALELGRAIEAREIDPRELVEHFLKRIGETDTRHDIFLRITADRARAEAEGAAARAAAGLRRSPLDGVPISWKDLYDTAGDITSHGALVLAERIAKEDATVVRRATNGGLSCLGKTNQTEFAFSILGLNPKTGTPPNPFDNKVDRLPGGSSSGAAVSLSRGLAAGAIGSDTGGSIRVPAAWNGLVGFKTSFGLIPTKGVLSLSTTLDTVGPLAHDVADAAALYALLSGHYGTGNPAPPDLSGARVEAVSLAVPETIAWDNLDPGVARAAEGALARLRAAGCGVRTIAVPEFETVERTVSHFGPYHAAECHATWHEVIEARPELVYAPIRDRILLGGKMTATAAESAKQGLAVAARSLHARMRTHGLLVMPTIAISPPPIAELESDRDAWLAANVMTLRNTRLGNFLDCCAITLPCGMDDNGIPVGLMVMAPPRQEARLLRAAAAMEPVLRMP